MTANLLIALANIEKFANTNLKNYASTYLNRINAAGEQLEFYIKDAFTNSFTKLHAEKELEYGKIFAYLGNQNNPPDMILKEGDAFEIKKIESPRSSLALNSSYPKDMLHSTDPRITQHCRDSDGGKWKEKESFYAVGYVKNGYIKHLFFVHGKCYAADKSAYEKIHEPLKKEITKSIKAKNFEYAETVELGKVKRVDPLGITELRIRGMWSIENPIEVFSSIYTYNPEKDFTLVALMTADKYKSFPQQDRRRLESKREIQIRDVKIKSPNNPAKLIDAKIITREW